MAILSIFRLFVDANKCLEMENQIAHCPGTRAILNEEPSYYVTMAWIELEIKYDQMLFVKYTKIRYK